jgi:peptidyl-tRNA hydrolase, PTH1 family
MKIIVGLGNPGEKYSATRHNAGFMFVDKLSSHPDLTIIGERLEFRENKKFQAFFAETSAKGEKIILAKPATFMNLSGNAVRSILDFYKCDVDDLIVVSDDLDIPVGYVRVRQEGSSGGQKGLQSIIDNLGTDLFQRIRIGIASQSESGESDNQASRYDAVDFVLSKFSTKESGGIKSAIDMAIEYSLPFILSQEKIPAHTLNIDEN